MYLVVFIKPFKNVLLQVNLWLGKALTMIVICL